MSETMTRIPLEIIAEVHGFIIKIVPCLISDTVIDISQEKRVAMMS